MIEGLSSGSPDEQSGVGKENSRMKRIPPTTRPSTSDQKAPFKEEQVKLSDDTFHAQCKNILAKEHCSFEEQFGLP